MRRHLLVVSEKKIKMLKTAFAPAQTCQPEGQEIREANRPGVVGASHAPNRGVGRRPGGGPGGEAPGSSWVYENFKVKNEVIEYTIYQLFTK